MLSYAIRFVNYKTGSQRRYTWYLHGLPVLFCQRISPDQRYVILFPDLAMARNEKSEHRLNHSIALIPQGICQMLVDVHGHIDLLMSQSKLHIL